MKNKQTPPLGRVRETPRWRLTVLGLGVGHLVVFLVKPVQVSELRQQLEDALSVVVQRRDLTAVQVQALQVLQVLLQFKNKAEEPSKTWTPDSPTLICCYASGLFQGLPSTGSGASLAIGLTSLMKGRTRGSMVLRSLILFPLRFR